jgi:hypothetical protein
MAVGVIETRDYCPALAINDLVLGSAKAGEVFLSANLQDFSIFNSYQLCSGPSPVKGKYIGVEED